MDLDALAASAASPILLATAAAMLFGLSTPIAKHGLSGVEPRFGALVSIGTTWALYLLSAPLWMKAADWRNPGIWVFALNGLVHPMLSMYLALEATARTGAAVAATFTSTAPIFAALTSVVFLGESLNVPIAIGTLVVVAGVATLSSRGAEVTTVLRAALLFATGAAVLRGINHTVGKWGMEMLPSPPMAAFVSFSVSFGCLLAIQLVRRGMPAPRATRTGVLCFMALGSMVAVAVVCMYGALQTGRVVVVSPLVATYPLFALMASLALRQERLDRQLLVGVLVTVGGVAIVSSGAAG